MVRKVKAQAVYTLPRPSVMKQTRETTTTTATQSRSKQEEYPLLLLLCFAIHLHIVDSPLLLIKQNCARDR